MQQAYSVRECLRGYTTDALATICERWHLAVRAKEARIRAIERVLADGFHVATVLAKLPAPAVRLLNLLARRDGVCVADGLSVPGLVGDSMPGGAFRELAERGFVLVSPQDRSGAFSFSHLAPQRWSDVTVQVRQSAPALVIPATVSERIPELRPLGVVLPQAPAPVEPNTSPGLDGGTVALLETFRMVEALNPRVTAQGELHKADTLHRRDAERARLLLQDAGITDEALALALLMARQMGCVEVRDGRLATTPRANAWIERSQAERTRELFRSYIESPELTDLRLFFPHRIEPTRCIEGLEAHLPPTSLRRTYHKALVAQILREQPAGAWFPVNALDEAVRRLDPNVLFLDDPWRAAHVRAKDGDALWKDRAWHAHEHRLFMWMVQSLLPRIGIVEVARDGSVFRLTPVGRYALGAGPAPPELLEPDRGEAVVVQANFEIIAYSDRCPPVVRRRLDLFCERLHGGPVTTYRLTQESAYRGVRTGVTAADFLDVLSRHTVRPIPENIRDLFATWQRKLETVTIRKACQIVECVSPAQAAEILAASPGGRLIGDRFVLIEKGTPPVTFRINYQTALAPCLREADGLQLRAPWEQAHLFLRRRLESVGDVTATEGGDLVLRLTPEKSKNGEDWSLIAADVESLAEKPLAARYRAALRAWNGDVAPAQSCTATVVRFDDPETCEAALELPDTAACVEGRLGRYTLVIRQGRLAQFKRGLKAHGIPIKSADRVAGDTDLPAARNGENGDPDLHPDAVRPAKPRPSNHAAPRQSAPGQNASHEPEAPALPSYPPRIVREILEDAISRRRTVLVQYQPAWTERPTIRRVNPAALDWTGPSPALSGYCHLQQASRLFRLSRIVGIRVLEDEPF